MKTKAEIQARIEEFKKTVENPNLPERAKQPYRGATEALQWVVAEEKPLLESNQE